MFVADLSSQSGVRRPAGEMLRTLNHLAPFLITNLLTNLLLDRLRQSAPDRDVMVSSNAQGLGRIDFDDLLRRTLLQPVQARQRGEHILRGRGPRPPPAAARPLHAAFHEDSRMGRRHVHPGGFRSRSRARDGPLLRQQQTQRSSERSYDEAAAARLWQVSAHLVGLPRPAEPGLGAGAGGFLLEHAPVPGRSPRPFVSSYEEER